MNLKRDFQDSWTFAVAAAIFILLSFLPNISDDLMGFAFLLLAGTLTYSNIKLVKRLKVEIKGNYYLMIYAAGFLSSMWVMEAIDYLL